jgi:putative sporulation protein YyaC
MGFSIFPSPLVLPKKIKCHYESPQSLEALSNQLSKLIRHRMLKKRKDLVVLCVGTDRSTGDCLGPLVGWLLMQKNVPFPVYGTLDDPVHAGNLTEKIDLVHRYHSDPVIIAVDACLGRLESVGFITLGEGMIKPGAGVHKELPGIGDIFFTGIVNVAGHMEFIVLQNTRLSLVMKMARLMMESISLGIKNS